MITFVINQIILGVKVSGVLLFFSATMYFGVVVSLDV